MCESFETKPIEKYEIIEKTEIAGEIIWKVKTDYGMVNMHLPGIGAIREKAMEGVDVDKIVDEIMAKAIQKAIEDKKTKIEQEKKETESSKKSPGIIYQSNKTGNA